ncbi:alpha/beta fold hydrolase [Sphingorhabdus sp. SMR4y]|uniref:alpha/beta fold hydrolase n=1 Tax=Sphingorhabdus sp. SMR4y TaxID=2584094 RepID=UPI000B617CC8|nr:alpha/beta fold hydrolase [Sphingorhabdus sp. SMR4y]ASK88081.1 carboxylesterase A [Sphingorhabdus sp. SMR4y]
MKYFAPVFLTLLAASALSACATPADRPGNPGFVACADQDLDANLSDSLCHETRVDHSARQDQPASLFVRKFPALGNHQGEIWLIAGGPGESGASFYADINFFRQTFADYDVMVPDHRGTGYSSKLCMPEETPDSTGGLALARAEWGSCFGTLYANPERAGSFNRRNAALDLDTLVSTLGSQNTTLVYGVSYGTSLALEYAGLATSDIDGIILDSLTPEASDHLNGLSYRSQTTNQVGMALLDRCATDSHCSLGTEAVEIYRALLEKLDAGIDFPGMESVPNGDLRQLLGLLLDVPSARNRIPDIIGALSNRDSDAGRLILDVIQDAESYWSKISRFQQATSSIPLSAIITGSEFNSRPDLTAEQLASEKANLGFTSPLPGLLVNNRFPLYEPLPALALPATMPPILILQGTLDPKTPYATAAKHAASLRARGSVAMLSLTDAPHAAYITSQDCLAKPLALFAANPEAVASETCAPAATALTFR